MSRSSGVADERFDEAGFEVPFTSSFEAEALSESETASGAEAESPFAESTFEAGPFEAEDLDGDSRAEAGAWSEGEAEYAEVPLAENETFPSGLELHPASGATGRDEEHWDPHQTGIPLLATGPDVQARKISPHFTVRELVSSGGKAASVARISPDLVRVLELIRIGAGKPVRITSSYRSWARNKAVYAARGQKPTDSRHCSGQAADIRVKGMSGLALGKLAIDAAGTNLGIGIGNTFIHVDVRGSWAMWTYFPKGGDADRKALAELSAHRARALRGGKPAPVPPAPKPPRPQPAPTPAGGASGRLVVAQHPMLRKHNGTSPDLILRWHRITQPGDIDVVVHFHGYGYKGQKTGVRIDRDKEKASGLDFSDPAAPGSAGRTRPTLAILPRGNYFGGSRENAYNFPALMPKGALQQLIRDALARVRQATGHSVQMGRLILTGHSGGGAPLTAVLAHTDPDEIHVFDGLYGSSAAIGAWAIRRIKRDLASPGSPPPAMRVLYLPGTRQYPGTQPNSEALAQQIQPTLSLPAASRLQPYFRVEKTNVGHNDIPATFGWRLLADAGADVPRATLYSGASGVTREAFDGYDEAGESFEPSTIAAESEDEQLTSDEALAWLDVEALTGTIAAEEAEDEGEAEDQAAAELEWAAESDSENDAESYDEGETEDEAEAALGEDEWSEAEDETVLEGESLGRWEGEPTLERDSPRARCQNLPTSKDKVSCSQQPLTRARLCAPGANLTCPSIPELWVSSTIEEAPFYYGAVVRAVEGTGGKRKALVRAENKSYQVRLTPQAWRAAQRWITSMSLFGMPIAAVITAGAGPYCRCIKKPKGVCRHDHPGGCTGTTLSNHGAGDAIDIIGVMWKDHHSVGSSLKVTLMHSWSDAEQAPLLVRINAALRLSFATVLDYTDPSHRDHFHVDTNNGVARSVFGPETERWFLAGCLRSLGYIQHYAKPPAWADVQPGLAAFARRANMAVPAADDKNAWRAIVARVYGCIALGSPTHCRRR